MLQKRLKAAVVKRFFQAIITLVLLLLLFTPDGYAQIRSAELQAAGLTCAMCSNAINKSLKTLKFIEDVDVDLKRSSFTLNFGPSASIDFDAIRNKVEDAGFSISALTVQATVPASSLIKGNAVHLGTVWICFVEPADQLVAGNLRFRIIDKGFVPDKEYKKYRKLIE